MTAMTEAAAKRDPFLDPDNFHPLELIPFFRRWRCSPLRDVLYTLIWNCLIGAAFLLIGSATKARLPTLDDIVSMLLVANAIGFTLHAIFMVTNRFGVDRWARARGQAFTVVYYTTLSTLGVFIGFSVVALAFDPNALGWITQPRWIAAMAVISAIISTIMAAIFFARARHAKAEAELERERLRAERDAEWTAVRAEKLGELAGEFDAIHSVQRAVEVGSVDRIVPAAELRPYLVDAVERGVARVLERELATT